MKKEQLTFNNKTIVKYNSSVILYLLNKKTGWIYSK